MKATPAQIHIISDILKDAETQIMNATGLTTKIELVFSYGFVKPSASDIISLVSKALATNILEKNNGHIHVFGRIAVFKIMNWFGYDFSQIAKVLAKDRTTMYHYQKKASDLSEVNDPSYLSLVDRLMGYIPSEWEVKRTFFLDQSVTNRNKK